MHKISVRRKNVKKRKNTRKCGGQNYSKNSSKSPYDSKHNDNNDVRIIEIFDTDDTTYSKPRKYNVGRALGKGQYGIVHKCNRGRDVFAVKEMKVDRNQDKQDIMKEIYTLQSLYSQCKSHLVCIEDWGIAYRNPNIIYIAMELLEIKDGWYSMDVAIRNEYIRNKCKVINNLFDGLFAIHEAGVIHNDINLDNIMVNKYDDRIKYIDFGLVNYKCGDLEPNQRDKSNKYTHPSHYDPNYEIIPCKNNDYFSLGLVIIQVYENILFNYPDIGKHNGIIYNSNPKIDIDNIQGYHDKIQRDSNILYRFDLTSRNSRYIL